MTVNQKLLEAIKSRQGKNTSFGMGISTADKFVKTLEQCVGHDICSRYACAKTWLSTPSNENWQEILNKASESLVYSNEDMVSEKKLISSLTGWKESLGIDDSELELPKNTLMVFSHVLTSPRKDRDGDRLRSEGAILDPKMLLLWQHIPTLPIGKLLTILEQNSKRVRNASCIVDMNELCHDAAVMIDNDMGRFSHGFRALAFDALKEEYDPETGPNGYDITRFEIMEESLVSVPSNVDAEVEEVILSLVEGGKLTSDLMKHRGKAIREKRPVSGNVTKQIEENEDEDKPGSGSSEKQGEREGKQGCTCPSKETNEDSTKEKTTTSDSQVDTKATCPECGADIVDGKCEKCGYEVGKATKPKSTCSECGSVLEKQLDTDVEKSRKLSVDQAIGEIISNASKDERAKLKSYLDVLEKSEASYEVGEQFRTLIAS